MILAAVLRTIIALIKEMNSLTRAPSTAINRTRTIEGSSSEMLKMTSHAALVGHTPAGYTFYRLIWVGQFIDPGRIVNLRHKADTVAGKTGKETLPMQVMTRGAMMSAKCSSRNSSTLPTFAYKWVKMAQSRVAASESLAFRWQMNSRYCWPVNVSSAVPAAPQTTVSATSMMLRGLRGSYPA
jgi:hypothetical protein